VIGLEPLRSLLASGEVDVFVTNYPESQLRKLFLHPEQLLKRDPKIVYGLMTPRGYGQAENKRGDIAAFWAESGFGSFCDYRPLPLQFGELVSSFHFLAAVCSGIFHAQRSGCGQLVDTSLLQCGDWSSTFIVDGFAKRIPAWLRLAPVSDNTPREARIRALQDSSVWGSTPNERRMGCGSSACTPT